MRYRYITKKQHMVKTETRSHIQFTYLRKFSFFLPKAERNLISKSRICYSTSFNRVVWYSHDIGLLEN